MKHIKNFYQIFEKKVGQIFTREEIQSLPGYRELIDDYGYVDLTTPLVAKSGNIRLSHPDLDNEYTIYSNGYIRQQPTSSYWGQNKKGTPSILVRPDGVSLNDLYFGREIGKLEDYENKFLYLKNYINKKRGLPPAIEVKNINISDWINKTVEENPSSIPLDLLKNLELSGKLNPSDFTKTILDVHGLGLL